MRSKVQIVHGGTRNGDYVTIYRLAKQKKESRWACGKETKVGDTLLIYFLQPHSEIVASAIALRDASPSEYWPYVTRIGKIKILSSPIALSEMREMFPRWKWLNYPQSKQYLDEQKAGVLLNRASLKLKTPPVSVKVSGAGFGTPEQNRLVEKAACTSVRRYFERRGYEVVSREKENLGYDFDVTRKGKALHIEVKGISGLVPKFPITGNEVTCARSDSAFQLALVLHARASTRKIEIFTGKEFLRDFILKPLAYFAAARRNLSS